MSSEGSGHLLHADDGDVVIATIFGGRLDDRLVDSVLGQNALDLFGGNGLIELNFPDRASGEVDSEIESLENQRNQPRQNDQYREEIPPLAVCCEMFDHGLLFP